MTLGAGRSSANPARADPAALALAALAATLQDERRARRFLDLTGLTPDELRGRADDPAVLGALLDFLEAHEPDLVEVADAIGIEPSALVGARQRLNGDADQ